MGELESKLIERLNERRDKLYDRIDAIDKKIRQLKLDEVNLDIEGKFIKYRDQYCYVTDVMFDKLSAAYESVKYSYLIRGHGFTGEFTGYGDATEFRWSYWYEFHISSTDIDSFKKQVEEIQIITKEEFDRAFDESVLKLKDYKNKYKYENKV